MLFRTNAKTGLSYVGCMGKRYVGVPMDILIKEAAWRHAIRVQYGKVERMGIIA